MHFPSGRTTVKEYGRDRKAQANQKLAPAPAAVWQGDVQGCLMQRWTPIEHLLEGQLHSDAGWMCRLLTPPTLPSNTGSSPWVPGLL